MDKKGPKTIFLEKKIEIEYNEPLFATFRESPEAVFLGKVQVLIFPLMTSLDRMAGNLYRHVYLKLHWFVHLYVT